MRKSLITGIIIFSSLSITLFYPALAAAQGGISVAKVNNDGVIGYLGARLGTIVTVEGSIVKNESNSKADSDEPYFLAIRKVDGKPLKSAVRYPVRAAYSFIDLKKPKIGDAVKYIGYETGSFAGSPSGEFKYIPAYTATDYHFETSFQILTEAK